LFEWGVALHDLDFEAIRKGEKSKEQLWDELKGIAGKARTQVVKDYIAFPALSGAIAGGVAAARAFARRRRRRASLRRVAHIRPRSRSTLEHVGAAFATEFGRSYRSTLWADVAANVIRNVWAHAIIFCGHFPDQTYTFSEEEVKDETKGAWYVRQLIGAANIEGTPLFHVISGNLGYQVEHHLYPDMPSTRYAEIAPRVKEVCKRHGLPYNTGPFLSQWWMVHRTIARLAFPGGTPRPKPGPYTGNGAAPSPAPSEDSSHERPAPTENVPAEVPGA
jgi:NADPH-dependent stearoyl-CoA 9-desaturase